MGVQGVVGATSVVQEEGVVWGVSGVWVGVVGVREEVGQGRSVSEVEVVKVAGYMGGWVGDGRPWKTWEEGAGAWLAAATAFAAATTAAAVP